MSLFSAESNLMAYSLSRITSTLWFQGPYLTLGIIMVDKNHLMSCREVLDALPLDKDCPRFLTGSGGIWGRERGMGRVYLFKAQSLHTEM